MITYPLTETRKAAEHAVWTMIRQADYTDIATLRDFLDEQGYYDLANNLSWAWAGASYATSASLERRVEAILDIQEAA